MKKILILLFLLPYAIKIDAQFAQKRFTQTYRHLYGGSQKEIASYYATGVGVFPNGYLIAGSDYVIAEPGLLISDPDMSLYAYLPPVTKANGKISREVNVLFFTDLDGKPTDTLFYKADLPHIAPSYSDSILLAFGRRGYSDSLIGAIFWISASGSIVDSLFLPTIGTINSLIKLPDSTYFVSGCKNHAGGGRLMRFAKITMSGEVVWTKEYNHYDPISIYQQYYYNWDTDAVLLNDTTIIVQYTTDLEQYGYLTVDLNGNVLNDKDYQYDRQIEGDEDITYKLRKRKSGKLVSTAPHTNPRDPEGFANLAAPIAGIDDNFTLEWVYVNDWFNQDVINHSLTLYRLYDLLVRDDGTILAAGVLLDTLFTSYFSGPHDPKAYKWTPVLLGLGENGNLLWQKYIDPELIPYGWIYDMAETADGGVILVGQQWFYPNDLGYGSPWALKLDKDYCYEPGCRDSSVLFKPQLKPQGDLEIRPNPANGKFQVLLSDQNLADKPVLILYNVLGQLMLEQKLTQPIENINISILPIGTYFVHINGSKGLRMKSVKLINSGP
jgi:Secretion system C-terminal sorting domain